MYIEPETSVLPMTSYAQVEFGPPGLRINDYDPIASVYHKVMGDDFATLVIDDFLALARLHLPRFEGGRYLDLGCGSAALLSRIASHANVECFGIDLSAEQIKWARRRLRNARIEAALSVGDVLLADFPCKCNVVAMNLDALNHLRSPESWLALFKRVFSALAEGGLFWFDINTPERLIYDWDYPEVILKKNLTYVQCPVGPCSAGGLARRQILMHVFAEMGEVAHRHSILVEQIALPTDQVFEMLRLAGFGKIQTTALAPSQAARHIFLKNRHFILANR